MQKKKSTAYAPNWTLIYCNWLAGWQAYGRVSEVQANCNAYSLVEYAPQWIMQWFKCDDAQFYFFKKFGIKSKIT